MYQTAEAHSPWFSFMKLSPQSRQGLHMPTVTLENLRGEPFPLEEKYLKNSFTIITVDTEAPTLFTYLVLFVYQKKKLIISAVRVFDRKKINFQIDLRGHIIFILKWCLFVLKFTRLHLIYMFFVFLCSQAMF